MNDIIYETYDEQHRGERVPLLYPCVSVAKVWKYDIHAFLQLTYNMHIHKISYRQNRLMINTRLIN